MEKSNIADTNVMFAEITLCLAAILENVADSTSESKEKEGKAFKKNWVLFQEWLSRLELLWAEKWQTYIFKKYCIEIVKSRTMFFAQNLTHNWS